MESMTGYGRAVLDEGGMRVESEVRCVNGRSLKISAKLPHELAPYELEIKKLINNYVARGSVYITVNYQDEQILSNSINENLLRHYHNRLTRLSEELCIEPPSLGTLLTLPGVIEPAAVVELPTEKWEKVRQVVENSLNGAQQMRLQEGCHLKEEILIYYRELKKQLDLLEKKLPDIATGYYTRLKGRLKDLVANEYFQYTEEDILREVALLTDRADISEEVARIKSHFKKMEQVIEQGEDIGKTLEFLLQEMIRESNTIACKANDVDCSQIVVQLKLNVEKIREQIQNVE